MTVSSKTALSPRRRAYDRSLRTLLYVCAGITGVLLVFLIGYIFYRGLSNISWSMLTSQTSYISDTIGILPNFLNTLYIILLAMVIVLPLGVGRAIGEAMAIIMVSGNVANMPGLLTSVRFLTTAIASEMSYAAYGSLQRNALYSIGLVLFLFIMLINVLLNVFIKNKKED